MVNLVQPADGAVLSRITDNEFPYHVYGAQQDTGSLGVPNRTDHGQITGRGLVHGGRRRERLDLAPDPNDSEHSLRQRRLRQRDSLRDRRTSLSQDITPWPMPNFGSEINSASIAHVDAGAGASPA